MPSQAQKSTLCFDEYRLEIRSGAADGLNRKLVLFRKNTRIIEGPTAKTLALLEYLLRHPQERLDREVIHSAIWVEGDDAGGDLDTHIGKLRKCFGDDHKDPKFIKTIHKFGFQFLKDVTDSDKGNSREFTTVKPARDRIKRTLDDDETRAAFEEFFGDGSAAKDPTVPRPVIVLQSESIDRLLKNIVPDLNERIKDNSSHRLFKARSWVNRWDTDAARALLEKFAAYRINIPTVHLSDKNSRDEDQISSRVPFQISMGLGFTDRTTKALRSCYPWMRVSRGTDSGDAIALNEKLLTEKAMDQSSAKKVFTKADDQPNFWRRLPRKWDKETYLDDWLASSGLDNTAGDVMDYAIIFRHTLLNRDHRQILLVLGGFTELSTAIAGRYLAEYWYQLWESHVKDKPYNGDFVTLIEGPSDPDKYSDWSEDRSFTISPKTVHDSGITEGDWYERVEDDLQNGQERENPL
jgi:DNA-binding winged helix-turn-helix (wHTH) protein